MSAPQDPTSLPPEDTAAPAEAPVTTAPAAPAAPAAAASHQAETLAGLDTVLRQVSTELLQDRRSDRRWRLFLRLSWLGLVAVVCWAVLSQHGGRGSAPSSPHTALIDLRGEIAAGNEASADNINASLKSAFEDNGAQAVILRINSPGGSPVQAGMIYDEIMRLKGLHKKKIYAVVEESCASGAYYIAAATDDIYVDKASIVGSIGVLMDGFGYTGLMDKLGVERRLLTAGSNKGMLDPFSPDNPAQTAYAKAMIEQIHQQFIQAVKTGRGDRLKETPEMFSGLFWNGEEAVKLGLADHLGSMDYVARDVVKAEDIVDYSPQDNVAERLAKRFGASLGEGAVRSLRSEVTLH